MGTRGSVYVLALGAATLVAIAGLSVVALTRAQGRSEDAARDSGLASVHARTGIELAAAMLNSTGDWRTRFAHNVPIGPFTVDRASVTLLLADEADGDLADDPAEPVRVTAVARVGSATRALSSRLMPSGGVGLDVLRSAAFSEGNLSVTAASASAGLLMSNGTLSNGGTLIADVEATGVSSTGFISGRVTTGASARRTLPGNAAWTALSAVATPLSSASAPEKLDGVLLSPAINPIGPSNPRGVYSVTIAGGRTLVIARSRLRATLLVTLEDNATLEVSESVNWEPGRPDQPALLVRGTSRRGVQMLMEGAALSESATGRNFNPPGTPREAVSNTTMTDTYPSEIRGVVHVMDAGMPVVIGKSTRVVGCVIAAGTLTIQDTPTLSPDPALPTAPPLGYARTAGVRMVVDPGTYRWEVQSGAAWLAGR